MQIYSRVCDVNAYTYVQMKLKTVSQRCACLYWFILEIKGFLTFTSPVCYLTVSIFHRVNVVLLLQQVLQKDEILVHIELKS